MVDVCSLGLRRVGTKVAVEKQSSRLTLPKTGSVFVYSPSQPLSRHICKAVSLRYHE